MENENNRNDIHRLVSALRGKEPELNNPEKLTDEIMEAIRLNPAFDRAPVRAGKGKPRKMMVLVRLLAAASVCLFIIYGYEQYQVVEKISRLENQYVALSQNSRYSAAVNLNRVISMLKSDPGLLHAYDEYKPAKATASNLLRAAFFYDLALMAGDDSRVRKIIRNNASSSTIDNFIRHIDSVNQPSTR